MNDDILKASIDKAYKQVEKTRYELWSILNFLQVTKPIDELDWDEVLIGESKAEIINEDVVKIYIPDYLPRTRELINKEFQQMWEKLIRKSLYQLKTIPKYDNAFVLIEIYSKFYNYNWDVDNKGVSIIINSLKGLLYKNDSCKHLSYGVKGYDILENEIDKVKHYTNIYVMDYEKYIKNALPFIS